MNCQLFRAAFRRISRTESKLGAAVTTCAQVSHVVERALDLNKIRLRCRVEMYISTMQRYVN